MCAGLRPATWHRVTPREHKHSDLWLLVFPWCHSIHAAQSAAHPRSVSPFLRVDPLTPSSPLTRAQRNQGLVVALTSALTVSTYSGRNHPSDTSCCNRRLTRSA